MYQQDRCFGRKIRYKRLQRVSCLRLEIGDVPAQGVIKIQELAVLISEQPVFGFTFLVMYAKWELPTQRLLVEQFT